MKKAQLKASLYIAEQQLDSVQAMVDYYIDSVVGVCGTLEQRIQHLDDILETLETAKRLGYLTDDFYCEQVTIYERLKQEVQKILDQLVEI